MKKRKMKADSVDQLFEIVKAVQMGQDPEEMLRKKQAESAPLADSPKSNPEIDDEPEASGDMEEITAERPRRKSILPKMGSLFGADDPDDGFLDDEEDDFEPKKKVQKKSVQDDDEDDFVPKKKVQKKSVLDDEDDFVPKKKVQKKSTADDGWDDDDDFMQILNDDSAASLDVGAFVEKIGGGLQAIFGIFAKAKKSDSDNAKVKKKADKKSDKKAEKAPKADADEAEVTEQVDLDSDAAEVKKDLRSDADSKATKTEIHTDADSKATKAEIHTDADSEAAKENIEPALSDAEELTPEELREKSEDAKTLDRILDIPNAAEGADAASDEQPDVASKEAEELPDNGIDLEEDAIRAKSDKEQEASIKRKISGRLKKEQEPVPEQFLEKPRKGGLREAEEKEQKVQLSSIPGKIRNLAFDLLDGIREKGIHRKELIMIAAGFVLAVLMIVMVVNFFRTSMEEKKKSENVTADAGLTITVEKEPDQWCQSYPVDLKVRVKGSIAQKVTIDGAYYEPNEEGIITVRARDYLLKASVESENGTLNAQIEIPKIDVQLPVVSAAREQDVITLTAADGRSGVGKIMYAVVRESDYIKIPHYEEYTEPFMYEADAMYYFYAEDLAGNRSMPVATTMEQAEGIVSGSSELCLFPGESAYLNVDGNPAGALLNNLTFESMNPSVVTVDGTGLITAVAEGTTAVKVKADGLSEVMCTVEVSRNRTITISAIGDCTLGSDYSFNTNINFQAFETVNGSSYFFQNVSDILENDDATFANLEGVFTDLTTRENKQYAFRGDPDYTQILLDGSVEVVTLANNHSSDYGEQSQKDTKRYLSNAGIDYCVGDTIAIQEIKGVKTAFIGIYVLYDGMEREEQVRATIAEARAQGAQLVIVGFHWGSEKATQPDQIQTSLAHIAVDAGADLVVGHHPHVLQGIEKYNGKYIVYSLGNFCFGGNTNPSDTDTIIFRQTFTITDGVVQDDDQIEIVPCSISGTDGYNDYQPTPVSGTEADRIMERLNEYSAEFGQTYTASTGLD